MLCVCCHGTLCVLSQCCVLSQRSVCVLPRCSVCVCCHGTLCVCVVTMRCVCCHSALCMCCHSALCVYYHGALCMCCHDAVCVLPWLTVCAGTLLQCSEGLHICSAFTFCSCRALGTAGGECWGFLRSSVAMSQLRERVHPCACPWPLRSLGVC